MLMAGSVTCLGLLMLRSVSFSGGAEFCELFGCTGEEQPVRIDWAVKRFCVQWNATKDWHIC